MIIIQSKLCLEQFRNIIQQTPFPALDVEQPFRVVQFSEKTKMNDLLSSAEETIIYTNIWPVTASQQYLKEIEASSNLKTYTISLAASLDSKRYKIVYPRKNHVIFPANSVAFFTLNSALLWNQTIQICFMQSLSLAMFAALAYDVVFHKVLHIKETQIPLDQLNILQNEYRAAQSQYQDFGLEIYRYESKEFFTDA